MPSISPKFGSAAVRRLLIAFVVLGCLVITTLTMLSVPLDQLLTASRIGDARNKLKSDNSSSDPMPRASSSDQEPKSVAYVISLFSAPLNPDKSPANESQILSSLRNEDAGGTLRIAADLIVLAESIRRATAHSAHRADLVALVRRSLLPATHDVLSQLGFRIIPTEVVVPPEDIVGEDGRAHATGDTSFGGKYLISDENDKLLIYNLTEYDRVVSLDTDALMVQPIDELFDHAEETQGTLDYYGLGDDEPDHPEGGFKQAVVPAINGGFVVVRPSREAFAGILDIYKRGDFSLEQVDGYMAGWDHIGTGYYYGGISFQGLLPAYYFQDAILKRPPNTTRYQAAQKALKVPEGRQFRELDQCVYNVLGHRNCWGREGGVQGTSYCRNVDCSPDVNPTIEGVKAGLKVIHFTGTCRGARPMDLCRAPAVELGGNCELCKEFVRRWLGIAESALASEKQLLYRQLA
eukprot:CAMPEP_0181025898 /NCGR_PEP_ID=MMETSP1070-20121207/3348_1 /TAXON_ID=265543 /ORGANISM="Minutocellus polymorphus, Strain NH13" /LENGTH=463 /DNA_ID=CAMNT_0023103047 /DNA_START=200 /DNA_END=1587 /DNA_ORIENTATION=+